MSVYGDQNVDDLVKIDQNHGYFLQALVMCGKPRRILELGFGAGEATRSILAGLRYNQQPQDYTIVDNWSDFGGIQPEATTDPQYRGISFVTSNELDFVRGCTASYDFIFSDADHRNTQDWFELVYTRLLSRGGILLYHDVTNATMFPNLLRLFEETIRNNYHYVLFNQNSRPGERCDRGLLAVFKH